MFTGIITDIGRIRETEDRGDLRVTVETGYDLGTVDIGASIACSGACLTVVEKGGNWFAVDVSNESISKTARDRWQPGRRLNLERALKVGDELGGHIVSGHVDAVGTIESIRDEGASHRFTFRAPAELAPYIAPKGSIAIDGVSLTVNEVEDVQGGVLFGVNIIPHTFEWTTFGNAKARDEVNLEIDTLARYLRRMQQLNSAV